LVYGRKYGVVIARCTTVARSTSMHATTVAAGCSAAISAARLGPETTTTRSGATCAVSTTTSLIRRVVPSSMPFMSDTRVASGARYDAQSARLPRSVCDGMARTTTSASLMASAAMEVAVTRSGSRTAGR
jgi:hypothetical protein